MKWKRKNGKEIIKRLALTLVFVIPVFFCSGQGIVDIDQDFELKEKVKKHKDIIEIYHVLKHHRKIKQGLYLRYLRKRIIVNGYYDNNDKVGIWKYYDGLMRVQLEYDYDKLKVVDYESFQDTTHYSQPPLLLGSTIELKYKINERIKYPADAWMKGLAGEIIVGVVIDTLGTIQDYTIVKGCAESLNNEALRVVKEVASEYTWLAAIKDDKYVEATYLIPIQFEMRRRRYY